ncbi:hypothetical protein PC9H_001185 [Pleurotus ostreatus]|uniref:Uncharacterized protein n=1 Tax=Pleurotus ostreatus TaxID=5322 RepID=A0A8H7A661_PLEOS|nr:uncharacterized protein PC9H_001185 [Pleurotus ostreatus]KAF7440837.1 hypothetical protein PC9H_001185 [Pleurotus ostreatus]KAJ8699733.1 hypothetical protein PTI98_002824 [Pleurotus ostreatus]
MEAPLNHANFNLNIGGIVAFLGGEEAISAMESMHFYRYRKWLGWYNSPGAYIIAKHYGRLARSQIWDGIYPGPNDEPAKLLGLDGEHGPPYRGIVSGTILSDTGHVGHVFAQHCENLETNLSQYSLNAAFIKPAQQTTNAVGTKPRHPTKAVNVIVVDLEETTSSEGAEEPGQIPVKLGDTKSPLWPVAIASVPISLNIACCIICGLYEEWFAFGVILYGILCNGIASYFIGSAKIYLKHTIPSQHSPPGNGILEYKSDTLIVCRGSEKVINYVVKGRFIVRYGHEEDKEATRYHQIGFSAMLLTTQAIAQLFLIPISGLFGQIMFLSTLAISWIYNAFLSSIDKERLQQQLLTQYLPFKNNACTGTKVQLPTRTSAVVFALLCGLPDLQGDPQANAECATEIMSNLLPKGTEVWRRWQAEVAKRIRELSSTEHSTSLPPADGPFRFAEYDDKGLKETDKNLLKVLIDDARGGYESYYEFLRPKPNAQSGLGGSPA